MALFATVPTTDPLKFRAQNGLDFGKVAKFLNLDKAELSKIGGVSKRSVRFDNNIPGNLKERLEQIAIICTLVAEYFDGDAFKTAQWFTIPNPMLGNVAPRDMIRLGRYSKLLKFINDARALNEAKTPE